MLVAPGDTLQQLRLHGVDNEEGSVLPAVGRLIEWTSSGLLEKGETETRDRRKVVVRASSFNMSSSTTSSRAQPQVIVVEIIFSKQENHETVSLSKDYGRAPIILLQC